MSKTIRVWFMSLETYEIITGEAIIHKLQLLMTINKIENQSNSG